jgi:hypothetical protein
VLKLVGILKFALPDHSDEDIFGATTFVTGALMHTLALPLDDFPADKKP